MSIDHLETKKNDDRLTKLLNPNTIRFDNTVKIIRITLTSKLRNMSSIHQSGERRKDASRFKKDEDGI